MSGDKFDIISVKRIRKRINKTKDCEVTTFPYLTLSISYGPDISKSLERKSIKIYLD